MKILNGYYYIVLYFSSQLSLLDLSSGISLQQPDIQKEIKEAKLEEKRERIIAKGIVKKAKEDELAAKREAERHIKPIVKGETNAAVPNIVKEVPIQSKNKNIKKTAVTKTGVKKSPQYALKRQPIAHRPQDIYKREWNMKDRIAL